MINDLKSSNPTKCTIRYRYTGRMFQKWWVTQLRIHRGRFQEMSNEMKNLKLLSVLNFDEKLIMHSISDLFTTYEMLGKSQTEYTGYVLFFLIIHCQNLLHGS